MTRVSAKVAKQLGLLDAPQPKAPAKPRDPSTTNHDALLVQAAKRGWWMINSVDSLTYHATHRDGRTASGEYSALLKRISKED